jgi:hypothetical protein
MQILIQGAADGHHRRPSSIDRCCESAERLIYRNGQLAAAI